MKDFAKSALFIASQISQDTIEWSRPPEEGGISKGQQVITFSLVKNTRGYIERLVHQINGSYDGGWYDSCAVMIRRLIETLIIEVFETHKIAPKIQNSQGDFLYLKDLISITLAETSWNLTRNTKAALPQLKDVGDLSAHSRRFNAHRADIEKVMPHLRIVVQELIMLAKLK